ETLMDKFAGADNFLKLEKLKLDLGAISLKNFETEFEHRFLQELELGLTESIVKSREALLQIPASKKRLDSFISYLDKGYLQWTDEKTGFPEKEILENISGQEEWNFFSSRLKKVFSKNPQSLSRLIAQYSDSFLEEILVRKGFSNRRKLTSWKEDFRQVFLIFSGKSKEWARTFFWENIFHFALEQKSDTDFELKLIKTFL